MLFALLIACEEPEATELDEAPALHVETVVLPCEEWADWSADWTVVSVQDCIEEADEVRCEASREAVAWEIHTDSETGMVGLVPRCSGAGERVVTYLVYR